jgi:hypothetical protein
VKVFRIRKTELGIERFECGARDVLAEMPAAIKVT